MNRTAAALALAIAVSMMAPSVFTGGEIAEATTVKQQRKKPPPPHRRKTRQNENMPGTNFRAARPEEFPQMFGDDCDLWHFGPSPFDCGGYFFHPKRNPVKR